MDYKYIEQLLERYWQCETTLEEEGILRTFFAQKDVPVSLLPYKDLFACQQQMAGECLGEDFDDRVLSRIQTEHDVVKARRVSLRYRIRPFYQATACIAIILTISMAIHQAMEQRTNKDAYTMDADAEQLIGTPSTAFDPEVTTQEVSAKLNTNAAAQTQMADSLNAVSTPINQ